VPLADQLGALVELQAEGKIGQIGLSEVSVADVEPARAITPIATVQNRYNLADRSAETVLDYCEGQAIGFIPWFPMAIGQLAGPVPRSACSPRSSD
jgi:pyridoxine 4-dehydrogenase